MIVINGNDYNNGNRERKKGRRKKDGVGVGTGNITNGNNWKCRLLVDR